MEAAAITMELANLAGDRFFPIPSDKSSVGRRAAMETLIYYIIMRLADRAGIRAARVRIGSSAARELPEERWCLPSWRQRLLSSNKSERPAGLMAPERATVPAAPPTAIPVRHAAVHVVATRASPPGCRSRSRGARCSSTVVGLVFAPAIENGLLTVTRPSPYDGWGFNRPTG